MIAAQFVSHGFDFGCVPFSMAVGSTDFTDDLHAAGVFAIAYGLEWSDDLNRSIPSIALVGRNGLALESAFATFNAWKDASDGDAVEITIVLNTAGGYTICLGPEITRLERRCFGYNRSTAALAMSAQWFKPIDSESPRIHGFRNYCSRSVAPFFFTAVSCQDVSGIADQPLPRLPGLESLLKFEISFVDEATAKPGTMAALALRKSRHMKRKLRKPSKAKPTEIKARRIRMLRAHFPVTLGRLRGSPEYQAVLVALHSAGIRQWQVEQAICNLVLRPNPGDDPLTHNMEPHAERQNIERITDALGGRYEMADGKGLPIFSEDEVRAQILADGTSLLRYIGAKSVSGLPALLTSLKNANLINARSALQLRGAAK